MKNDLTEYEAQVYSQGGEDGVLEYIYDCIGTTTRSYVEFGAWNGQHLSNTANLRIHKGWSGLLMEGSDRAERPLVKREFINAENVEALFAKYEVPETFDLLSIDIDGNDYWVWKAIESYTPRVVVVEYNILFTHDASRTIAYAADHVWDKSSYHGASLGALHKLGIEKGYSLVHTDSFAPNALFVKNSELPADYQPRPLFEMAVWDSFVTPPQTEDRVWVNV